MDERELAETVAGGGWLGAYVHYARSLTDAPLLFHVGAGLAALAAACGNRITWVGGGGRTQWPNLYVLLLAPSGLYRKSTSVELACGFLERACPGVVMDREFSPEQFIRSLAEHPTSLLKEAEFSSLLERLKANYMGGLKQRLTELYDCTPEYSRHIRGEGMGPQGERVRIVRPALSVLAASTTDWLVASITELDLRSGFLPRFLFWPSAVKEPEPKGGYWAEPDATWENKLVGSLGELAHRDPGVVAFGQVGDQLVRWNARHLKRAESQVDDLSGLYSRLGHHVAKLCALLTVSEALPADRYEVTPEVAERACALVDWVVHATERTFEEHLQWERFERKAQSILAAIPATGTDRSLLLKRSKLSSQDFDRYLRTLRERMQITIDEDQPTGGRFKTVIRRLPDPVLEPIGEISEGSGGEVGKEVSPNGLLGSGQ